MEKMIEVSPGVKVLFKASGSTPRIYRRLFMKDIFTDMSKLSTALKKAKKAQDDKKGPKRQQIGSELPIESLEIFENVAYCMAYQADESIPKDPDEWLDQFDMFSIYNVLPQIIGLWNLSNTQIEKPKKKAGTRSVN